MTIIIIILNIKTHTQAPSQSAREREAATAAIKHTANKFYNTYTVWVRYTRQHTLLSHFCIHTNPTANNMKPSS